MNQPADSKLGGIRLTSQRKTILETVRQMHTHPTADEVYLAVRETLPKVSLGTVYRNLESLSEAGYILKLDRAGSAKRFDGNLHDHMHIRCTQCGRIEDVKAIATLAKMIHSQIETDFTITGHDIALEGICPECKRKSEA